MFLHQQFSLTVPLKTFPDLVLGNLLTTIANLKAATGPTFSLTKATHSFVISLLSLLTPALMQSVQ